MSRRILVAEDDPAIRSVIADTLRFEGFEVKEVPDGGSAVQAVSTFFPHVAVLDIMMPVRDGLDVLEHIRSDPSTSGIPVIILTAKDDAEATWAGWRAGCDYYMAKPFDPEDLVAAVSRLTAAVT